MSNTNHEPETGQGLPGLSRLAYFSKLPQKALEQLERGSRQMILQRNEIIVHRGDRCTGLHIVVHGQVKLCHAAASGLERVLRILENGESFGEAFMLLRKEYLITAESICESRLIHVQRETMLEVMNDYPQLARNFMDSLSRHLYMIMGDMTAYTVRSGHQRLIGYLFRESLGKEGIPFHIKIPKGVIASKLNLTPQHFSRILQDLGERGLIRVRGREFTILDAESLREYQKLK